MLKDATIGVATAPAPPNARGDLLDGSSPAGRLVATGGIDPNGMDLPAHLVVWDLVSSKALRMVRLPHGVNHVAFSPDASVIAAANLAGGVKLWPLSELPVR